MSFAKEVLGAMANTAKALGMEQSPSGPDTKELQTAWDAIQKNYDVAPMAKLMEKLSQKQQAQAPQVQQPVQQAPVQPQQPTINPESHIYSSQLNDELVNNGIASDKALDHIQKNLWPMVAQTLAKGMPGKDPSEVYHSMSPRAQYDAIMHAQSVYAKQQAALKPKPAQPTTARPVRTTGTQKPVNTAPPVGSGLAAARYLASGIM